MILTRDLRPVVYDRMRITELNKMMSVSKAYYAEIKKYFDALLDNPERFFERLAHECHFGSLPVDAMSLLNKYHKHYRHNSSPVKSVLEMNGTFIVKLFDKHVYDGKAITVLTNAVARIASSERMEELWRMGELPSYYYILITDDVKKIRLKSTIDEFEASYKKSGKLLPMPLVNALHSLMYGDAECLRNPNFHEKMKAKPLRNWERSSKDSQNCFPINRSGIISGKIHNDLVCAIVSGWDCKHGTLDDKDLPNLFGSYIIVHTYRFEVGPIARQNLRYSYFYVKYSPQAKYTSELNFSRCNLSYAILDGIRFNHLSFSNNCNFSGTELYQSSLVSNEPYAAFDDPDLGESLLPYLDMDLFDVNFRSEISGIHNSSYIMKIKHRLLDYTMQLIDGESTLDAMSRFHRTLLIKGHLFKFNRISMDIGTFTLMTVKREFKLTSFSSHTNSWNKYILCLKSKCMKLMKESNDRVNTSTIDFLNRLRLEKTSNSIFDSFDQQYSDVLKSFMELQHNRSPDHASPIRVISN